MNITSIDKFPKGWICGDLPHALIQSKDFEVAVKYYKEGDREEVHHHKIAREITVIVYGTAIIFDKGGWCTAHSAGSIIDIAPGEAIGFSANTDCITIVIKTPSVPTDKYLGAP